MKSKLKKIFIITTIALIFLFAFIGSEGQLVEELNIPVGVGYDLYKKGENEVEYSIPFSLYELEPSGNIKNDVRTGVAKSIGETREDRQNKSGKKFSLGLEKVYVFSEEEARYGIRNVVNILINNPQVNDKGASVVCSGKAEELLKQKINGYPSSADFIDDMIKNSKNFNFFSDQYRLMDLIVRIDAEGRSVVLPYIELKEAGMEITGLAIFKGDKMIGKIGMGDAKVLNLLDENSGKGMLTIQRDSKEYINYYAEAKRKVKCYKEEGKFKFIIDLNITGAVVSNGAYKDIEKDPKVIDLFQKDMEVYVKDLCNDFIDIMKNEYKVDMLGLGRVAAAKYGRGTGMDWNKVISDSDIEVNVKVKVDTEGRGFY